MLLALGAVWISTQVVMSLGQLGARPLLSLTDRSVIRHFLDLTAATIPLLAVIFLVFRI